MTTLRRLSAVLVLIATVAALGIAWEHSGAATWVTGPSRPAPTAVAQAPGVPTPLVRHAGIRSAWPNWSDLTSLERTVAVEVGLGALVIASDLTRRRRKRH